MALTTLKLRISKDTYRVSLKAQSVYKHRRQSSKSCLPQSTIKALNLSCKIHLASYLQEHTQALRQCHKILQKKFLKVHTLRMKVQIVWARSIEILWTQTFQEACPIMLTS